ncbi:MAG TPA: type II secretion system F family protein, partial [Phycisphaerae bacterium]|nr:type II secretion system F family protein [Phycisphaerae bacterium]
MATYRYQLKRNDGQVVTGVMKADSLMLATQQVRELGGTILDLIRIGEEEVSRKGLLGSIQFGQRVGSKEILAFTSQLAVMSKAGIGLTTALESIGEQVKNPKMGQIIRTLKRDIEGGRQFSE